MRRYIAFIISIMLISSLLTAANSNSYMLKETSAIYSKEYIADVGNLKELKNAYAAGIEIMKQTKLQVERYEELTLEQKKKLYTDLNRFICAISEKEELGSGDIIVFACIAEFRNILALDLLMNSVDYDFLISEFKNPEINLQKLQGILLREFSYSSKNKTLGETIRKICGFNKTSGTIDDYRSAEMFNHNFFSLISNKDLKGFVYKYNKILISSAITKLTIVMNRNAKKKIKIGEKYVLFYENMNASQRQLSGINTPKYISSNAMRSAVSSLDSTIDSCRYFLSHDKKYLQQILTSFHWMLS